MMNKQRNIWLVLLLVVSMLTSGFQATVLAAEQSPQSTVKVMGVDEGNPLQTETVVELTGSENATEALIKAVGEENVEFLDTAYGRMLNGIKGLKAEGTHFWAFYINGIMAPVGADAYQVMSGDKLSFRYTDWTKPAENTASLKVFDKADQTLNDSQAITFFDNPTAFDLLFVTLGADKVEYLDTQYGKMITSINGIAAEGTYFWAFYVNGQSATVGADSYQLKPGDEISFKYKSWEDAPVDDDNDNGTTPPAEGTVSETELNHSVEAATQYVLSHEITEWEAIALRGAGKTIPSNYLEKVKSIIKEKQGSFSRITDTERYVLGILAAGANPTNIEGYNLVDSIYNGNVTKQGLNGVAYALLALDSANFEIPATAKWTRESLVDYLLERQNADGGWAWDGSATSDIDTTGMVLTALAPYKNQSVVTAKVEVAVQFLTDQYNEAKIDNSSTAAQVIIALSALGIDSNGSLFTKDDSSLLQLLISFQNADGGFDWQGGDVSDVFSTQQGIQAVVAYQLFVQGKGSLYHIPVIAQEPETEDPVLENPETENPVTESPVEPTEQTNTNGHKLPNTATDSYNLLLAGMLLMLIGGIYFCIQTRRRV
jgi:LPXTG-motif cell wall-anchored protein